MELALSVLAGLFIWSGFAPVAFPLGPLIGMAILSRVLINKSFASRLKISSLAGATLFFPLLHWSGSYVGWFPWMALALLQTALFSLLALFQLGKDRLSILLFAASFTAIEILRMKWPFGGFGWGRIGHTQVEFLTFLYPFLGIAGITFVVATSAAILSRMNARALFILPIFTVFFLIDSQPLDSGTIKISAVQGGVDKLGLDYNQRALSVLNRHATASIAVNPQSELIIWPENSSDIDPIKDPRAREIISGVSKSKSKPLLVGAVLREIDGPRNVSILYSSTGEIDSLYTKQDLAPFGEYMPIRNIAEFFAPEAKRVRDFIPGSTWVTHQLGEKRFVSLICFEILDDDFVRSGMEEIDFAVAQTNNATFGRSPQAEQQLQIIRSRAAESRRDFAVVSTTGFTAHIDSRGKIVEKLEQFKPGVLEMTLRTGQDHSPARLLGSWFWLGLAGAVLLFRLVRRANLRVMDSADN